MTDKMIKLHVVASIHEEYFDIEISESEYEFLLEDDELENQIHRVFIRNNNIRDLSIQYDY